MSKEAIRTEAAPAPFQGAPYSQAIRANGLVFVSGQLALQPGAKELVPGGITEQTEQLVGTRRATRDAGAPPLAGLEKTPFSPNHPDASPAINEVSARHIGATPPARSTVEVAKLPSGALVEIE